MGPMFPFSTKGSAEGAFLDELVGVDEGMREAVVVGKRLGTVSQGGGGGDLEGGIADVGNVGVGFEDRDGEGVSGVRGKRVRDLSRLWMYLGGGSPEGV